MAKKKILALLVSAGLMTSLVMSAAAADTEEGNFNGIILNDFSQDDFMAGTDEAAGTWWQNTFGITNAEPEYDGKTATFSFSGEDSKYRFASKDGGVYSLLAVRMKAEGETIPGDKVLLRTGSGDGPIVDKDDQNEPFFSEIIDIDGNVLGDIGTEWQTFFIDLAANGYSIDGTDVVTFHIHFQTPCVVTFDYIGAGQIEDFAVLADETEQEEVAEEDSFTEEETVQEDETESEPEPEEVTVTAEEPAAAEDKGNPSTGVAGIGGTMVTAVVAVLSSAASFITGKRTKKERLD